MNIETLEMEALKLPPLQRIRFADFLLASVDAVDEREREERLATELDSRWAAFERGEIESEDAEEVFAQARRQFLHEG